LREWLYGNSTSVPLRIRIAPSPITRSEADLLHVASPRFAYRVYLSEDGTTFVNARRLKRLLRSVPKWAPPSSASVEMEGKYTFRYDSTAEAKALIEKVSRSSCIADSFLSRPIWLSDATFELLSVDLGAAYGERESLVGSPYVKSVRIGPGLCAQAACFMSVLLCGSFARAVHDFAEISCIGSGHDPSSEGKITFAGMHAGQILTYLNSRAVGLAAELQGWDLSLAADAIANTKIKCEYVNMAVRAYVRSGFPVIYLVEAGPLWNKKDEVGHSLGQIHEPPLPILDRRLIDRLPQNKVSNEDDHHAVVVVGYRADSGDMENVEFIIHDPSSLPFVRVSGKRLFQNRITIDCSLFGDPTLIAGGNVPVPSQWCVIPVVPDAVKVTLLDRHTQKRIGSTGLIAWSIEVQSLCEKYKMWGRESPMADGSDFYLVAMNEDQRIKLTNHRSGFSGSNSGQLQSAIEAISKEAHRIGRRLPDWNWFEIVTDCVDKNASCAVWVWDATQELPPHPLDHDDNGRSESSDHLLRTVIEQSLIGVVVTRAESTEVMWGFECTNVTLKNVPDQDFKTILNGSANESIGKGSPKVKLSLITSFCGKGFKSATEAWPEAIHGKRPDAEVYCFMERDLLDLQNWFASTESLNAKWIPGKSEEVVQWMSRCCNESKVITSCGQFIDYHLRKNNISVTGLASYFPHVTHEDAKPAIGESAPGSHGRHLAVQALVFLARLARELRERGHKSLRSIELVAGSRVTALWPAIQEFKTKRISVVRASYLSAEDAGDRLLNTLEQSIEKCRSVLLGNGEEDRIRFGIECEPGQMFTIGRVEWAQRLAEKIQCSRVLRDFVCINLDLAHAMLLGLTQPAQFGDAVTRNVINVHLSGHSPLFHFGDSSLAWYIFSMSESFGLRNWLHVISRNEKHVQSGEVPVSVEFEAAKSGQYVRDSVSAFVEWVGKF